MNEIATRPTRTERGLLQIDVHDHYLHLWLKQVWAVDVSRHCYESLVGQRDWRVRPQLEGRSAEVWLRPGIYYLCGVTRRWERNAHLAFVWRPGAGGDFELPFPLSPAAVGWKVGISAHLKNFERIEFDEADIDPHDPNLGDPKFRTCRNWQFAHRLRNHGAQDRAPRSVAELGRMREVA
jgi:hypothetical protein